MKRPLILIVDDEENNRAVLESRLERRDYGTVCASNGTEALKILSDVSPDLVLLDLMMPGMDGFETCTRMREITKGVFLPIIMLTANDDKESRIRGFSVGADDYIDKPFDMDELSARIGAMLRIKDLKNQIEKKDVEIKRLSAELKGRYADMIGTSAKMKEVFEKMRGASGITSPVVISGESGTGKELVAKGIHYGSSRASMPFVAVNCAALPKELIESELFGHKKGAFTGAQSASEGLFRAADGGTLFLDEITEMPAEVQAKMLRVLQEGTVRMVGSVEETPVDVRVIAATNLNVEECVKAGKLRQDLYYRLNVLGIKLPPLRERKEDIPLLARFTISRLNDKFGKNIKGVTEEALEAMVEYDWPGNVRELQNVIESCYAIPGLEAIDVKQIRTQNLFDHKQSGSGEDVMRLSDAKKKVLLEALAKTGNNKLKAAKMLGIHRSVLYKMLERHGIKE
ncbi:MAG: sigma-54-dependent Fis family transcriptional regulator [Nitrospinae bacterium]|nr:sigma-54-dependent Fis family transcriptional regulator [Nitrospinota bacterium]